MKSKWNVKEENNNLQKKQKKLKNRKNKKKRKKMKDMKQMNHSMKLIIFQILLNHK
jgi:hypothetical protein